MIFFKKYLLAILFFAAIFLSGNETLAQKRGKKIDISGQWEGKITQKEGGYKTEYYIVLRISQQGNRIKGRSNVFVDDIKATMEIEGKLRNGLLLEYKEVKMTDFTKLENMEWCMKKVQLILKKEKNSLKLEGFWQGKSKDGPCIPGEIYLKKTKLRA